MRVDPVQELLEHWETLVERLQHENVVLRAERDEARYALALIGNPSKTKTGRRYTRLTDEEVMNVSHLSTRQAAEALGVSVTTVMNRRRVLELAQREPLKIVRTGT